MHFLEVYIRCYQILIRVLAQLQVNFTISKPDGMGTTNVTDDNGNGALTYLPTISLTRYVLILINLFISVDLSYDQDLNLLVPQVFLNQVVTQVGTIKLKPIDSSDASIAVNMSGEISGLNFDGVITGVNFNTTTVELLVAVLVM